jgi:hypothetical protein
MYHNDTSAQRTLDINASATLHACELTVSVTTTFWLIASYSAITLVNAYEQSLRFPLIHDTSLGMCVQEDSVLELVRGRYWY